MFDEELGKMLVVLQTFLQFADEETEGLKTKTYSAGRWAAQTAPLVSTAGMCSNLTVQLIFQCGCLISKVTDVNTTQSEILCQSSSLSGLN